MNNKIFSVYKHILGTITFSHFKELLNSMLEVNVKGIEDTFSIIYQVVTRNKNLFPISLFYRYNFKTRENNIDFCKIYSNYMELVENYSKEPQTIIVTAINIDISKEENKILPSCKLGNTPNTIGKLRHVQELESRFLVYEKDLSIIEINNIKLFEKNRDIRVDFIGYHEEKKYYELLDIKNNIKVILYEMNIGDYIVRKFKNIEIEFYVSKRDPKICFFKEKNSILYIKTKSKQSPIDPNKISYKFITIGIKSSKESKGSSKILAIGYYDGENLKTFYVSNYKTSEEMISALFKELFKSKYKNYVIYIHNIENYDAYFIYNTLRANPSYDIKILVNKGKIISFNISYYLNNRKYNIFLYDSYNLLPYSISKLVDYFNIEVKQPIEGSFSSLKNEIIISLNKNLKSHYFILTEFNKNIYNNFGLNITNSVTLLTLALNIYRSNFYKHNIPIIQSKKYIDIKESFYGNRCEVFIPSFTKTNVLKKGLYFYKINFLYPFVMKNLMPVGKIELTNNSNLDDIFGFSYAKIETPQDMYYPVLPFRKEGELIFPIGKFEGWYFSEELKYAKELGYKIEVIKSYVFDKEIIFEEYVNHFYSLISSNYQQGKKIIGELLLDSLYRKFSQFPKLPETDIINIKDLESFILNHKLIDIEHLDNKQVLVHYETIPNSIDGAIIKDLRSSPSNVSVAISSAIASYARIYIHKVFIRLQELGINVYYTDTDSIVVDQPLPEDLVGTDIGKFKEVYGNIKEGYFPLPKIYGLKLDNDSEIINFKGLNNNKVNIDLINSLFNSISVNIKDTRDLTHIPLELRKIEKNITLTVQGSISYNKRDKIYKDNVWFNTKPLKI